MTVIPLPEHIAAHRDKLEEMLIEHARMCGFTGAVAFWRQDGLRIVPPPPPPEPEPLSQGDPVGIKVRGKHAAHDNVIPVKDESGKTRYVNNLSTRIDPSTTSVVFMSACEGTVCLRLDDNKHSDFWIEFNVDVPTLERLLAEARATAPGAPPDPS